ncbi:uncharacterized protein bora [Lepeophtheirus salmonis]|uniref:uncharacterized protein bora n=1 Tax=Lepeophtheirus salmonis TaxID=72036 RepID=UPI001AE30909|nr:protein aurora borealis-like [Lepeophtheirus salmonis]
MERIPISRVPPPHPALHSSKLPMFPPSCDDTSRLLFRTPGRSSSQLSVSSNSSSSKKTRTPSGPRLNPFETAREDLHLPVIMSPSIFATVQSPSQVNDDHFWSLEDRAALFPVHISEDSPWKQEERKLDPETEIKTQEALNRYFDHHHQITSPHTNVAPSNFASDASTQTELSFPAKLPEEIENLLARYTNNMGTPGDSTSMSNASLRRKLFTNIKGEELDETVEDENNSSNDEDETAPSSPIRLVSPGRVILTPPREGGSYFSKESDGIVSSITPPFSFGPRTSDALPQIMDSPLFSPISKTQRLTKELNSSMSSPSPLRNMSDNVLMQSVILEENNGGGEEGRKSMGIGGAAMMPCLVDQNVSNMDTNSASCSPIKSHLIPMCKEDEDKKSSTKLTLDNLTSSMTFNDVSEVTLPTNYSSSTMGYCTGNSNNHPSLSTIAESVGNTDSGMVTGDKSVPFDFFPSSLQHPQNSARPKSYMVSYGVEEHSSDISVGFPLGSSTPTK